MNSPRLFFSALLLALGACQTSTPNSAGSLAPPPMKEAGLGKVIGRSAAQLTQLFGPPDLDAREVKARRLQFAGPACVLDVYLYPPEGGGEPVANYVDARTPRGDDIDRASCVAALSRRQQAP